MYENFYKFIFKSTQGYRVTKENEDYGTFPDLATALFERDRLESVDWDWEAYVHLPELNNPYIHIDLPPFSKRPSYISHERECWVVRDKGARQKHRGRYKTLDEAKKVALIYNANVSHKNEGFSVRRRINGKSTFFGRYRTWEEAEKRVKELEANNWSK